MPINFILFIFYMLSPKISIFESGSAAVRPEDFIVAVATARFLFLPRSKPFRLPAYVKIYLVYFSIAVASSTVNYSSNGITGFLYSIRLLEYLIWFCIIYDCADEIDYASGSRAFYATSMILVIWGWLEYFGLITKIGRFAVVESRLSLNTSGPFETSVMLAALAYITPRIILTPMLAALVWLTQARITLAGAIISFVTRRPARGVPILIGLLLAALFLAGPIGEILGASRFSDTASPTQMGQMLSRTWQRAQTFTDPASYRAQFSDSLIGFNGYFHLSDPGASFNLRAVRWSVIAKSTVQSWPDLLIGFSPGAWGIAVDGFYVRTFGETGLAGLVTFIVFLFVMLRSLRRDSNASFLATMMIVVALFIDIFSSSKVVPMLWALAALDYAKHPLGSPGTLRRLAGWRRYQETARTT